MKITESSVSMSSTRQYSQTGIQGKGISGASSLGSTAASLSSNLKDSFSNGDDEFLGIYERLSGNPTSTGNVSNVEIPNGNLQTPLSLQKSILNRLMNRLLSKNVFGPAFGASPAMSGQGANALRFSTYQEYESTSFSAAGCAKTEDGRTIDFSIDIMMTRSYMEYTDIQIGSMNNALIDPLVVNVGRAVTGISDQKFLFDLDADGTKDEISMLQKGSGFLALDLNEDGIVNDGRELFGTQTGDGFGELRKYDSDGNGWIDEADDVFGKLKVWCKGDNGEDILMSLKEAGVGAIYLGEQNTEFSQYGMSGLSGVIKSTGFFLREDGGVGTVQHVDMATSDNTIHSVQSFESENGQTINLKITAPNNSRNKKSNVSDADTKKTLEEIRKRNRERRKELNARLAKKKRARKEMLEKQLEKRREKSRAK